MIRFGPSGNSDEFYEEGNKHTYEAMKWLSGKGLNAFEYSFGRGVKMKEDTAKKIGEEAKKYDIALSAHAPYYINFASEVTESKLKNIEYVYASANAARMMGAKRIVVHPGSGSKINRADAMLNIKEALRQALEVLDSEGFGEILLCPETMGRVSQMGTLDEIVEICKIDERLIPTIDFGHLYARTQGGIRSREDFMDILETIENGLGRERLNNMHCHFSKIEYNAQGEKRHLTFDNGVFGPDYSPLVELIADKSLNPVIICESNGTMAKDALSVKTAYEAYLEGKESK